jgi:hypothetical protein
MTQFRIGGVYREVGGGLSVVDCRIDSFSSEPLREYYGAAGALEVYGMRSDGIRRGQNGWRRASDGGNYGDESGKYTLLPGELQLKDGQWVPVEEKPAGLAGPIRKQQAAEEPKSYADAVRQEYALHKADAAMIARDGPAKPAPVIATPPPKTTAKPSLKGLTLLGDSFDPKHGSAFLAG